MKGLGKILFGGILGAIFGFLISPKRGQSVRDALLGRTGIDASTTGPALSAAREEARVERAETPSPSPVAVETPPQQPTEPHWAATATEQSWVAPPAAVKTADTAPIAVDADAEPISVEDVEVEEIVAGESPVPAVEVAEPGPGLSLEEPPSYPEPETVEPAPVAVPEQIGEPVSDVVAEAALVTPLPESVETGPEEEQLVAPSPEIFEGPFAGPGWTAPAAHDEEPALPDAEEPALLEAEDVSFEPEELPSPLADEAAEMVEVADEAAEMAEVADLKARIEETRRRIQRELEHPFDDTGAVSGLEPPPTEVEEPGLASDQALEQESPVEESVISPTHPHEEEESFLPSSTTQPTPWEEPAPVAEVQPEAIVLEDTPVFEIPDVAEQPPVFEVPPPEEMPVPEAAPESATVWEPLPSVAEAETVDTTPSENLTAEADFVPAPAAESSSAEIAAGGEEGATDEVDGPIAEEAPARTPTPTLEGAEGSEFDHEAMRRRIEETRNRLKAKAFDAMMSGETALLGRDGDEALRGTATQVQVDSEVSDTIESTLTEEDT